MEVLTDHTYREKSLSSPLVYPRQEPIILGKDTQKIANMVFLTPQ